MLLIKRKMVKKNKANYYLLTCVCHSGMCNSTLENDLEDNSFLMQRLSKATKKKTQDDLYLNISSCVRKNIPLT